MLDLLAPALGHWRSPKWWPLPPLTLGFAGALGWLGLAAVGIAGVLAVVASANLLARPTLDRRLALALALPELALLATAKSGLLLLLR